MDWLRHPGYPWRFVLRYINHKMRREAFVPIDDELAPRYRSRPIGPAAVATVDAAISAAQGRTLTASCPLDTSLTGSRLNRWLAPCDIRDESGAPGARDAASVATHLRHSDDQRRRAAAHREAVAGPQTRIR